MNFDYLIDHWQEILVLTREHILLCAVAIGIALLVAIPMGIAVAAFPGMRTPVLVLLAAVYTIPSLAFLAFLIPSFGLGDKPAIIVLSAYAQLALVRNIQTGFPEWTKYPRSGQRRGNDELAIAHAGQATAGAPRAYCGVAHRDRHHHLPGHGHRMDRSRRARHAPVQWHHVQPSVDDPGRHSCYHRPRAFSRSPAPFR